MKIRSLAFLVSFIPILLFAQPSSSAMKLLTPFEQKANYSATYPETRSFYNELSSAFQYIQMNPIGSTDSGEPLHEVIISTDQDFSPESNRAKGKTFLMINNAIHPGEPCGVDATMMLVRDYLTNEALKEELSNIVLVIIPFYNIGGGLNRNKYSRANQNGPEAYGFRGNAKNLDLNRDFVKCDTKNAQTFNQLFQKWMPDVLIDNHTSNGADYQYTITVVTTQHNKLEQPLADFLNDRVLKSMYRGMKASGWELTPYVYSRNTPDDGIYGFLDLPRFSSGYAALFNTISFMPETHMFKPFEDRVKSTYAFMENMIAFLKDHGKALQEARAKAIEVTKNKETYDLNWELDPTRKDMITFKGYEAKYKPSEVSGKDRLYYDRNAPFEKEIPFYNYYKANLTVEAPMAYIIPQAYTEVIDRLKWNGVAMKRLKEDQVLEVEMYRIKDYKDRSAYEGHYLHYSVEVEKETQKWKYYEGDYVIFVNQSANNYIISALEPQAPDSYFAWNFFDGILGQKEYFSSYVFEDKAAKILKENPEIRKALEARKKEDPKFAESARAQLNFVYERSEHYEPTHRLYPVGRVVSEQKLN